MHQKITDALEALAAAEEACRAARMNAYGARVATIAEDLRRTVANDSGYFRGVNESLATGDYETAMRLAGFIKNDELRARCWEKIATRRFP